MCSGSSYSYCPPLFKLHLPQALARDTYAMYSLSSSLVSALLSLSAAAYGWPTVSAPVVVRDYKPCCNNSSQHGFAWTVVRFQYNASYIFSTPAHQIDYGVVAFNLTNPALASPAVCSATSTQLQDYFYGDMIYKCSSDAGTTTTFTFNAPSEVLTWNQTWVCADANPVYL